MNPLKMLPNNKKQPHLLTIFFARIHLHYFLKNEVKTRFLLFIQLWKNQNQFHGDLDFGLFENKTQNRIVRRQQND